MSNIDNELAFGEHVSLPIRMEGLKPCPFCGARGDVYRIATTRSTLKWDEDGEEYDTFTILERWVADCYECDCVIGENFFTEKEAIAAWNRRAEQ